MKHEHFYASIVEPTVSEFLADTKDLRRGLLAAMTLYHMLDCAAIAGYEGSDRGEMQKRCDALRDDLIARCPDFSLLGDIANAAKHIRLATSKVNSRQITDANQVRRRPGLFDAPFGEGYFAEAICVEVRLNDGQVRTLEEVVRAVQEMWRIWLDL